MPGKWRTTRKPYVSRNPARSTTRAPPTTTTRPPVRILKTNVDGTILTEGVKISNRGRKLVGPSPNMFNHFTTEMPSNNYDDKNTTPDTTEIYSFFGQPGFNLFNSSSKFHKQSTPTVSYSTVIVHGPNPKPGMC